MLYTAAAMGLIVVSLMFASMDAHIDIAHPTVAYPSNYASGNVTNVSTTQQTPFAYIVGNTSETDGFPAYEGPGVSQNQSMPQYMMIVLSASVGTTANISLGGKLYFSGVNVSTEPTIIPVYTNLTGVETVVIVFFTAHKVYADVYTVSLMLVATFIHYEQGLHPVKSNLTVTEASLGFDIVWVGVMVVIGDIARHGIQRLRWMRKTVDDFFR